MYYISTIIFILNLYLANTQVLRVGVLEAPPVAIYDSTNNTYSGFGIDLWDLVTQSMDTNSGYSITTTFIPLNSAYDMAIALYSSDIDVAIYGTVPPPNVYKTVDSSVPYLYTVLHTISLTSSEQTTFELVWHVFIDPTFLAFLLIIALLSIIAAHIIWTIEKRRNEDFRKPYKYGIGSGLYWAWSTISLVGFGDVNPITAIGKGFTVFIVILSLVILNIFSGIVCSYVTTNSLEPNPPTRDAFSSAPVAAIRNSYAVYFLQVVNAQIVEVADINEGIAVVKNSTAEFFVGDQSSLLSFNNTDPSIEISGPSFDNLNYTFFYSSTISPTFSRDMDRAITLVQLSPMYKTLKDIYLPLNPPQTQPSGRSNLERLWTPAIVIAGVIFLFFVWIFIHHLYTTRSRNKDPIGRSGRNHIGNNNNNNNGSSHQ